MKPKVIDLWSYAYVTGHTTYCVDLAEFDNSASVYIDLHCNKDVTIELVSHGDGSILHLADGRHIKQQIAILNADAIRFRTKAKASLAYHLTINKHGGQEILDPVPVVIIPQSHEFHLSRLIRQELSKRLAHMGLEQGDVDDILDEEDFDFEDEEDPSELPEDTEYTELEETAPPQSDDPPSSTPTPEPELPLETQPPGESPPETDPQPS